MHSNVAQHIRKECTISGISNVLFNGVIAWLLLKGGANLTLGGEHSFAVDMLATGFILPFIVTLIVIPLQRKQLQKQALPAIQLLHDNWLQGLLARFPEALLLRALVFGAFGMLVLAPLCLLPMWLLGVTEFTPTGYSVFKGLWAGAVAALLATPMILLGLSKNNNVI